MEKLAQKLKVSASEKLLVLGLPQVLFHVLEGLSYDTTPAPHTRYEAVLAFAPSQAALEQLVPLTLAALAPQGKLWMAYPKKSSAIKTDINRDQGWGALVEKGYGAVAAISLDTSWSALRFRPEEEVVRKGRYRTNQPLQPAAHRQLDIPPYLQDLLEQHPAEKDFFESLAFTHRKEYLNWIIEAKKPETRQRRLEQLIGLLQRRKKNR